MAENGTCRVAKAQATHDVTETNGMTNLGRRRPDEHALATVKALGSTRFGGEPQARLSHWGADVKWKIASAARPS